MVADDDAASVAGGDERGNPWAGRVAVARSAGRSFAYRPGRVLVARRPWQRLDPQVRAEILAQLGPPDRPAKEVEPRRRGPVVLTGVADPVAAATTLRDEGVEGRVDHVFFAVPVGAEPGGVASFAGVGGAPVMFGGVGGAPVMFGGVGGAPVMFGGVGGTPVMFGGVGGAPVMFGGVGGGCGCCATDLGPPSGTPTPPRRSTVAPAEPPPPATGDRRCRVVVLDTGLAAARFLPQGLAAAHAGGDRDHPDVDGDRTLDAAAGHATFIGAIVEALAPGAEVQVRQVLSTFGDGADSDVAAALWDLVDDPPQVLNLSFAGYTDDDTAPLAIRGPLTELVRRGVAVIAAAGNDATCRPAWPASHDGIVAVAALGPNGPAWFTNHGPWVRACAPGVDVVSRFFTAPAAPTADEARATEALGAVVDWATWSGTSFAAPIVAGVVARTVLAGRTPAEAVASVVDDPGRFRLAGLGTVVNERPY